LFNPVTFDLDDNANLSCLDNAGSLLTSEWSHVYKLFQLTVFGFQMLSVFADPVHSRALATVRAYNLDLEILVIHPRTLLGTAELSTMDYAIWLLSMSV
jgi:hypothetical protein